MGATGRRWRDWAAARWRWFWGLRAGSGVETARQARGRLGEDAAVVFLRGQGLAIVARNWRHGHDELDVVAREGDVLVFCEVRARAAQAAVPGYFSVSRGKKQKVARAARAYLRGLDAPPAHFRFDIVEVSLSDDAVRDVRHHANVPLFAKHFHAGGDF
jgi:putative endonuclease